MMQGSAVQDYVVLHELFGAGVERLHLGAPVVHRLRLPLSPGRWLIHVTITAGVSNVSFNAKLAEEIPGVKVLGGTHNGAMSPHFSPATMTAFIDNAPASNDRPIDLVVTFESVGPNAIAVLGHRSVSVMAWTKVEPVVAAKPKAEKPAPVAKAEKAADKPPVVAPVAVVAAAAPRKEPAPKAKPAPAPAPQQTAAPAPVAVAAPKSGKTSISAVKQKAAPKSAPAKAPAAKPAPAKAASAKRK
jgi:hypothetical protein